MSARFHVMNVAWINWEIRVHSMDQVSTRLELLLLPPFARFRPFASFCFFLRFSTRAPRAVAIPLPSTTGPYMATRHPDSFRCAAPLLFQPRPFNSTRRQSHIGCYIEQRFLFDLTDV
jgi:hypothetical protein